VNLAVPKDATKPGKFNKNPISISINYLNENVSSENVNTQTVKKKNTHFPRY